jgi:NurA-like 5'-3' nuclease
MEKEIAEKVIEKLGKLTGSTGKIVQFSNETHKPVEFSKDNFRKIEEAEGRIAFIDGGNNSVFYAASFSLQFARIYWTIYSENKRKKSSKKEFFVLVSSSSGSVLDVDVFGADLKLNRISAFDKTLAKGKHRVSPAEFASECRKLAEIKEAVNLVDELDSGDIIVLDRDLQASVTGEKELFDELYKKAEEKNIIICGIAKTARLFTETGDSALAAVSSIAPGGEWYYSPLAEINSEEHKAEICLVKFHEKSRYVFRFEIYKKQEDKIGKVLGILKKNSADPVFLGYPYGLIEADRFARVSNDEAEYLKVKLTSKAGDKRKRIIDYMKSVDAHSVLDNIS